MKKMMSIFLSIVMIFTLTTQAFAVETTSNRVRAALNAPEFLSDYEGVQVVNEVVEEVPGSDVCYIYHDLSNGNSISYMLQGGKVVYKAYVVTAENKVIEYSYSDNGNCTISTESYSHLNQSLHASNASFTYAGQIKYRTPMEHLGTIYTYYMDCSYKKTIDYTAQYNVAKEAQNKAAYASFLAGLIGLPIGFASTLAGAILGAFGLGAGIVAFAIPDYMLDATKETVSWNIKDTKDSLRKYTFSGSKYTITDASDEKHLHQVYEDYTYFSYSDFVNENKTMADYCQTLLYNGLSLEPVEWII